jgi:hypothetical protein
MQKKASFRVKKQFRVKTSFMLKFGHSSESLTPMKNQPATRLEFALQSAAKWNLIIKTGSCQIINHILRYYQIRQLGKNIQIVTVLKEYYFSEAPFVIQDFPFPQ